jgi:hypothetical protein
MNLSREISREAGVYGKEDQKWGRMIGSEIFESLWKTLKNYQMPQSANVILNSKILVDGQSDEKDCEGERGDSSKNVERENRVRRLQTAKAKQEEGQRGRPSQRKESTRRKLVQTLKQ